MEGSRGVWKVVAFAPVSPMNRNEIVREILALNARLLTLLENDAPKKAPQKAAERSKRCGQRKHGECKGYVGVPCECICHAEGVVA